jgi:hypothetical protein
MAETGTAGTAAEPAAAERRQATAIGFVAVLLWALLALFTVGAAGVPPFQLTALSFLVGGLIGVAAIAWRGLSLRRALGQPARVWALGVAGLFGYHFFYFTALKAAPPAEAGLVAYLWPLLIVLFSALLPGGRLGAGHLLGGLRRRGAADPRGARGRGGLRARASRGLRRGPSLRAHLVGLFGAEPRRGRCAHGKRGGFLPRRRASLGARASGARGDGVAR